VTSSLRLGRIAGIEIGVNWSWLVVFALITWTLASAVFPSTNPHLSKGAHIAMAIVAAVCFFVSLLAHELGHAIQARRDGMEIDGITLWLFGGVARFKGMFPSAGAEFRIAVAGPLVSLALGLVFVLVAWAIPLPAGVDGIVAWLGYINLSLLVFNLLPALPLDGGRMLRSALWYFKGDFRKATLIAAAVARGLAFVLIAAGLFLFIFQSSFSGAWLAFIGWFLLQAAGNEARYLATRQALGGLRVRDLMVREPVTVDPDMTLGEFMDQVAWSRRHTTYPVVDGGHTVGLLPFRCVAEVPRREWDERRVRDCMLGLDAVPVLDEDTDLVDALGALSEAGIHRGLVVDGDRLVGLLSISDLARALEVGGIRRRRAAETAGRTSGAGAGSRAGRGS
jgi:Zn-dependent protease/predicted transcriptional regulator